MLANLQITWKLVGRRKETLCRIRYRDTFIAMHAVMRKRLKGTEAVTSRLALWVGARRVTDETVTTSHNFSITQKFERFITSRQFSHNLE